MGEWLRSLTTWLESSGPEAVESGVPRMLRSSLGLQQFLPTLLGTVHPAVLDLGCVWQATVALFTENRCKVYAEDLFLTLAELLQESEGKPARLARRFHETTLEYPEQSFRGILAWDLFDYLPDEFVEPLVERLYALLEPGGVWLGLFHTDLAGDSFVRYRTVDAHTLELLPSDLSLHRQRVFQNRELLKLFSAFRSSRTFVGRDHLRELLLVK